MDSGVRKRRTPASRTPDVPADVSHHADVFIQLCDSNERRMRQVVEDLQDISTKLQRLHRRTDKCSVVGTVTAAVGLGAAVAAVTAQVPGGLSLALTAAVGYVAAAAAVVTFRAKQFTTEEERVKKTREFLQVVAALQSELENMTQLCTDPQREAEDIGLVCSVLQPVLAAELRSSISPGCGAELSEQCEKVWEQFRSTKRKLEEIRGGREAEKMQEEEE